MGRSERIAAVIALAAAIGAVLTFSGFLAQAQAPGETAPESLVPHPSKVLTASGRVRLARHLVWVIEASSAMNAEVQGIGGLLQHKGVSAIDLIRRSLELPSPEVSFSLLTYRGVGEVEHFGVRIRANEDFEAASRFVQDTPFGGGSDLLGGLKEAMRLNADGVLLVVAGMPDRPWECPDDAEVMKWIVDELGGVPAVPPIHVLGVGLDAESAGAYERLARLTGGTVTETYRPSR